MPTPVSILIPCYNAETHLAQCLESAIANDPQEIILLDDGSTDESLSIAQAYPQVSVHAQANQGAQKTRNNLFAFSTAAYIQYLDADDYLYPTKLADQLALMAPGKIGYCDFDIDRGHQFDGDVYPEQVETYRMDADILTGLVNWYPIVQTAALLFPRAALEAVPWDESMAAGNEHKIIIDLIQAGFEFVHTPTIGFLYRQAWQESQITANKAHCMEAREVVLASVFAYVRSLPNAASYEPLIALRQKRLELERWQAGVWEPPDTWFTEHGISKTALTLSD